jgi:hypothetical protein
MMLNCLLPLDLAMKKIDIFLLYASTKIKGAVLKILDDIA